MTGECNLTAGTPPLHLFWQNVKTGQFVETGKLLTITNITRYQTEYGCVANNTCGRASATMFIDVQCKEEYMISLQIVVNTSTNATVVIDFFVTICTKGCDGIYKF